MTKHILTFGTIAGIIVLILMYGSQSLAVDENGNFDYGLGEKLGYISMIVSLSMIFFGIKSYRDNHLSGNITFGKAFKIGILITLVASAFYILGWMVYYHTAEGTSDFIEQHMEYSVSKMEAEGISQEKIDNYKKETLEFAEIYENPLVMAGATLMEIFPVGLVITLLSSFILKKNKLAI